MDPFTGWDKQRLFGYGVEYLTNFLALNGIDNAKGIYTYDQALAPERRDTYESRVLAKLESGPYQGTGTGWYKNGLIFVCLQKASRCILTPKFQNWSHPHYRVDREPVGVVCHEGGHHIQAILRKRRQFNEYKWRDAVFNSREGKLTTFPTNIKARLKVKRVTNYEPNLDESFAESMRLFILNPFLLQAGLEKRFDFIANDCGLHPSVWVPWRDMLQSFDPAYTTQAEKWIAR